MRAISVATATILALGGAAYAQQGAGAEPAQVIAYLDKDADGKCSQAEYLMFQHGKLTQFDADANGELSLKEFRESLQGPSKKNAERSFDAFNSRGRTLDQKEFLTYHAYVFQNYVDDDRDGFMSAEEWAKLMKAVG